MAPTPDDDDTDNSWDYSFDPEMTRGLAMLGMMVGMFVVGTAFGMAVPQGVMPRLAIACVGVAMTYAALRVARAAKDRLVADEAEQEHLRTLRRWSCTSDKYRCADPVPHVHRGDWVHTGQDDVGDKVYT